MLAHRFGALLLGLALGACAPAGPAGTAPRVESAERSAAERAHRPPPEPAAQARAAESAAPAPPSVPIAAEPYQTAAQRIRESAAHSDGAWQKLAQLTDGIGPRLSGSAALTRALDWARVEFVRDGQEHVALEPVRVTHWVRGAEACELVAPEPRELHVLGLGGSVATPPGGIEAEIFAVSSFAELDAAGARVRGKIVLFNHVFPRTGNPGLNYGEALPYRTEGAVHAARLGARAVLVRSLTATSLGAPHTGALHYASGVPPIPAAALSVEDAELLARLAAHEPAPRVRLRLSGKTLPDAPSANVIAELVGRTQPEEVVVLGAHLDSWDVGQGAQDDGAGCVLVMEALRTLRALGLTPRRTLRAVLFTNEENGVCGAKQYVETHRAELARHVAAIECDLGAGAPRGFMTDGSPPWLPEARAIGELLAPIGASLVVPGFPGQDILELAPAGSALFGLLPDIDHYFDVHHSAADTLDKIDPANLKLGVAALATFAYVLAEQPQSFRAAPSQPAQVP